MSSLTPIESTVVWRPSASYIEQSRLTQFMRRHQIGSYASLFRRSVEDLEWFWNAVNEDLGLEWIRPYTRVYDSSAGIPWTKWWIDGKYNYVHNCLDRHLPRLKDKIAIRYEDEEGTTRTLTYRQALVEVSRLANGLKRLGIPRMCDRDPRGLAHRRHLHPDLLRLRRPRGGSSTDRL